MRTGKILAVLGFFALGIFVGCSRQETPAPLESQAASKPATSSAPTTQERMHAISHLVQEKLHATRIRIAKGSTFNSVSLIKLIGERSGLAYRIDRRGDDPIETFTLDPDRYGYYADEEGAYSAYDLVEFVLRDHGAFMWPSADEAVPLVFEVWTLEAMTAVVKERLNGKITFERERTLTCKELIWEIAHGACVSANTEPGEDWPSEDQPITVPKGEYTGWQLLEMLRSRGIVMHVGFNNPMKFSYNPSAATSATSQPS